MKKALVGVTAIVVCAILAGLFVTRDIPATNRHLQSAQLPPLIPTRAFYADPAAAYGYIASSDGKLVSFQKGSLLGRSVVVKEVETEKEIASFPSAISGVRWHPTKPLLRFIFEGHDWEVDPSSPDRENWKRISPVQLSGGWQKIQFATSAEKPVLIWGKSALRGLGHMWLVSQDGLKAEKVAEGNPKTLHWIFDQTETKPVLRVDSLDPATVRMFRKTGEVWEKLIDIDLFDGFVPLSHVREDQTILARSARGRDKVALVEFDTLTGDEKIILENPSTDIAGVTNLTNKMIPDVIRSGSNNQDRVALTEKGQVFLDILAQFPQPVSVGFTAPTASERYVTVAISPQNQSFTYLLIDLEQKTYKTLGEFHIRRFKDSLVQDEFVSFTSRDGLNIPAIITMPKDIIGPVPFVVNIHGGPSGHFTLGYDHEVQFLVNRGYGVLSVNFRGSNGFGKSFQSKGFKEFGRSMQDDITDAAQWLIKEGKADPDALAVMGTSYGGYSAALAMTRDPDLFKAAIVEFPLLDVEFQSKHHPGFWDSGIDGWSRYFGKLDNPEDLKAMKAYSPSSLVEKIHGPVMILAGIRDQITAVQQVKDFKKSANEAGKNVTVQYFPNAGHGVYHWRDKLRRARIIEDFLAEKLGGRSGGFEFAERAPKFID